MVSLAMRRKSIVNSDNNASDLNDNKVKTIALPLTVSEADMVRQDQDSER